MLSFFHFPFISTHFRFSHFVPCGVRFVCIHRSKFKMDSFVLAHFVFYLHHLFVCISIDFERKTDIRLSEWWSILSIHFRNEMKTNIWQSTEKSWVPEMFPVRMCARVWVWGTAVQYFVLKSHRKVFKLTFCRIFSNWIRWLN